VTRTVRFVKIFHNVEKDNADVKNSLSCYSGPEIQQMLDYFVSKYGMPPKPEPSREPRGRSDH
jgi:hypothetical protein